MIGNPPAFGQGFGGQGKWRAESGGQRSEIRGQRSEVRNLKNTANHRGPLRSPREKGNLESRKRHAIAYS
jgi:hypothetical protein